MKKTIYLNVSSNSNKERNKMKRKQFIGMAIAIITLATIAFGA